MKTFDQLQKVLDIKQADLAKAQLTLKQESAFKELYLKHFGNIMSDNGDKTPSAIEKRNKMTDMYETELLDLQNAKIRVLQLEEQIKIIKWIMQ